LRAARCMLALALAFSAGACARRLPQAPPPLPPPSSAQLSGELVAHEPSGGSREAIVYLQASASDPARTRGSVVEATIRRGAFDPNPAVVLRGSRVAWTNADAIYHGVFSLSQRGSVDLGVFAPGERRELELSSAGAVRVHCPIHVDEAGVVFVAPSPHFVRVLRGDRYSLRDLPPGRYWLRAWSDGWIANARDITLRAGESAHADIVLRLERP
jgi:plastocyanin